MLLGNLSSKTLAFKGKKEDEFEDFDEVRFVSVHNHWKYQQQKRTKGLWFEEGILVRELLEKEHAKFKEFYYELKSRGWDNFCATRTTDFEEVVREFYANIIEGDDNDMVREREYDIPFDSRTINQYYAILEPYINEYKHFVRSEGPRRFAMIKDAICVPNSVIYEHPKGNQYIMH